MRDIDGKPFIKQSIDLVKKAGKGWVDYQMTNSVTNKIEAKSTYVVETSGLMLACGVYK
jgi:cytochrome c